MNLIFDFVILPTIISCSVGTLIFWLSERKSLCLASDSEILSLRTTYISFNELTELQHKIMVIISEWCKKEKTPIPLTSIMAKMKEQNIKAPTAVNAIKGLLQKGYIRRACIISNKSYFVMLRSI